MGPICRSTNRRLALRQSAHAALIACVSRETRWWLVVERMVIAVLKVA
jgi:hypothetical protein